MKKEMGSHEEVANRGEHRDSGESRQDTGDVFRDDPSLPAHVNVWRRELLENLINIFGKESVLGDPRFIAHIDQMAREQTTVKYRAKEAVRLAKLEATKAASGLLQDMDRMLRHKYLRYVTASLIAAESLLMNASKTKESKVQAEVAAEVAPEVVGHTYYPDGPDDPALFASPEYGSGKSIVSVDMLDPEATEERVRRILDETLPKGWVTDDVGHIMAEDMNKPTADVYGIAGGATIADVGDGGHSEHPADITFYRGDWEGNSDELWNDTLLHEIAHANDWERDASIDDEMRNSLEGAIAARVDAPDRFQSSYVEKIKNNDPDKERELKMVEYWAEISAHYLSRSNPASMLSPVDLGIVEAYISATDPDFDRDEAYRRREEILSKMREGNLERMKAGALEQIRGMGELGGALAGWLETEGWMTNQELVPFQVTGRAEVASALTSWATTTERRVTAEKMIKVMRLRDWIAYDFQVRQTLRSGGFQSSLENYVNAYSALKARVDVIRKKHGEEEADAARRMFAELDSLVTTKHVAFSFVRAGDLALGEAATLEDKTVTEKYGIEEGYWVVDNAGWSFPESNDVFGYGDDIEFGDN